jgi:hypothetical protein
MCVHLINLTKQTGGLVQVFKMDEEHIERTSLTLCTQNVRSQMLEVGG